MQAKKTPGAQIPGVFFNQFSAHCKQKRNHYEHKEGTKCTMNSNPSVHCVNIVPIVVKKKKPLSPQSNLKSPVQHILIFTYFHQKP